MSYNWQETKKFIEKKTDDIWLREPDDIKLVRWGIIKSGAGTGKQYFTCLVLMETYTLMLGQRLLYPFMLMAISNNITLETMKIVTKTAVYQSFNPMVFLADLGLSEMDSIGNAYINSLDSLETKQDFLELTGAFCTYCNRMHRWVHHIFPWNLGLGAFPQRDVKEMKHIVDLLEKCI